MVILYTEKKTKRTPPTCLGIYSELLLEKDNTDDRRKKVKIKKTWREEQSYKHFL